jgi:hypothetical protein
VTPVMRASGLAVRTLMRISVVAAHGVFADQVQPHASDLRFVHDTGDRIFIATVLPSVSTAHSAAASSAFRASRQGRWRQ